MNDETEFEGERRPILRRRRPEPDPAPDHPETPEPEPARRRRFLLNLGRGLGHWFTFLGELPVVLRLVAWGLVALLGALVFRTLRGTRK